MKHNDVTAWVIVGLLQLVMSSVASGITPRALEDAYWRFEEGTNGQIVPATDPGDVGAVLDSTGNGNHMRQFADVNAPAYTTVIPAAVIPGTGQANNLALRLSGTAQDVYTQWKDINNPIVTAFTLEASFNADVVGGGVSHAIVSKESTEADLTSDAPPLALKIRGETSKLRIEIRDKSNNLLWIDSINPIQPGQWYHAAVVATADELELYLAPNDGSGYVLQGSVSVPADGPLWQGTDPEDGYDTVWNIGKGMFARDLADWFDGVIDEVRLSNRALDQSEFLWTSNAIPGDFDHDGNVDAEDYGLFESCATGPEIPYAGAMPLWCTLSPDDEGFIAADMDADGDVDQDDFGAFQATLGTASS